MWQDEIDDPDYQDPMSVNAVTPVETEFFYQPITSMHKPILNAITGEEYPYRIGSKDEERFYVIMENDPNNYKEARRLYFDSPEQYERATGRVVPLESKRRFYNKKKKFM
jgi:hypothetical protein